MSKTNLIFHNGLGGDIDNIQFTSQNSNVSMSYGSSIITGPTYGESTTTGNVTGPGLNNWNQLIIDGVTIVENKSDNTIQIINNELPLEEIIQSSGGAINITNNYNSNCRTSIKIGDHGVVALTGVDLDISSVNLKQGSSFHFNHGNNLYHICAPINKLDDVIIQEPHKLVKLAHFLSAKFINSQNPQINLNEIEALRIYEANKKNLDFFNGQNGISYDPSQIDTYIVNNISKLTAITKNLSANSELKVIVETDNPNIIVEVPVHADILGEALSYLTLGDVPL